MSPRCLYRALVLVVLVGGTSCTPVSEGSAGDSPTALAKQAIQKPLPPEEAKAMMKDVGHNWLYGNGVGETTIAVGSIVAFPPMVLYWLGNAALGAAGYEPIGVSRVLPKDDKKSWNEFYDDATSGPGRMSAAIAGEEFVTRERAKERLEKYMPKPATESEGTKK